MPEKDGHWFRIHSSDLHVPSGRPTGHDGHWISICAIHVWCNLMQDLRCQWHCVLANASQRSYSSVACGIFFAVFAWSNHREERSTVTSMHYMYFWPLKKHLCNSCLVQSDALFTVLMTLRIGYYMGLHMCAALCLHVAIGVFCLRLDCVLGVCVYRLRLVQLGDTRFV